MPRTQACPGGEGLPSAAHADGQASFPWGNNTSPPSITLLMPVVPPYVDRIVKIQS